MNTRIYTTALAIALLLGGATMVTGCSSEDDTEKGIEIETNDKDGLGELNDGDGEIMDDENEIHIGDGDGKIMEDDVNK